LFGFASFREAFFILRSTKMAKGKKQEKAPKSCEDCEHWTEVKNKLRVGTVLENVLKKMEEKLGTAEFKPSLADYLKLVQMEKEMGEEGPKEIRVTWVEPVKPSTAT
jgi:NAD(P)H-nitrite reductase large subunit